VIQASKMEPSRRDPSCEKINHGHKINTTPYRGNTMTGRHPQICQEKLQNKNFGTDAESDLTVSSSQEVQISDFYEGNMT
jgi:hypothetical protein